MDSQRPTCATHKRIAGNATGPATTSVGNNADEVGARGAGPKLSDTADAKQHASVPTAGAGTRGELPAPATPIACIEIEACDECGHGFAVNVLWRVRDHGLLCGRCIDELRDSGLAA